MGDSKQIRIERASKLAGDNEELMINCAQGTLAGLLEEFMPNYVNREEMMKAASFLQGVVNRGETCGAVQGGVMFLGLMYGKDFSSVPKINKKIISEYKDNAGMAVKFCKKFKKEFGSTMCGKIHPQIMGREYDFLVLKDSMKFIIDEGGKKCRIPCETAASIIAELILNRKE